MKKTWLVLVLILGLAGCATSPPSEVDNVCEIFQEKSGWYKDAKKARARWDVPISVIAFGADQIEALNVVDFQDMQSVTPNLNVQPGRGSSGVQQGRFNGPLSFLVRAPERGERGDCSGDLKGVEQKRHELPRGDLTRDDKAAALP